MTPTCAYPWRERKAQLHPQSTVVCAEYDVRLVSGLAEIGREIGRDDSDLIVGGGGGGGGGFACTCSNSLGLSCLHEAMSGRDLACGIEIQIWQRTRCGLCLTITIR